MLLAIIYIIGCYKSETFLGFHYAYISHSGGYLTHH